MAVAHDASGSGYLPSLSGTNDFANIATVGGTATALVVGLAFSDQASVVSAVTWDQGGTNQACTVIGTANAAAGGIGRCAFYGLVSPTTGLKSLRVAISSGFLGEVFVFAESFTGSTTTSVATAFTNFTSATGNSTTSSIVITSASGNLTVDLSSGPQVMSAPTKTQIFVDNGGSVTSAGASRAAGAGTNTHQWTLAGTVQWVALGVNVAAPGGGAGPIADKSRLVNQAVVRATNW
jgi:hypothetical protein